MMSVRLTFMSFFSKKVSNKKVKKIYQMQRKEFIHQSQTKLLQTNN